ncbi:MAG: NADP-dependent oxidoreductase [Alphaproteobacteria bacterium]|jgi:hypothetical protein|nr:NADP-dependent oxidoreductase [Rhodospirillaceae bacterium]MDP6404306.1 NADP-dependent oxidoreductase [Alphaproteobacteria bacterium]MDP6622380.1 NADP-dependent oxidoreductase [Alphaproteobacteria bacterium]|tara:strand:- start:1389 stop:2393 length:1005 start_codon:yes stop_codon:yes gene_type:complete
MTQNKQILVREIPRGALTESHFEVQNGVLPTPTAGELLVRTLLISLDAANRAWLQGPTYRQAVKAGDVMHGYVVGQVVQSEAPGFAIGDIVAGEGGWAEFVVMPATEASAVPPQRPLSHHVSVFGIAGKTAYHGLLQIGEPRAGETVAVSAAAGSVGSLVGQIARLKGARAVGIAGGPEKCRWLVEELGFAEAVDYKAKGFAKALAAACPDGIDVYFDNTGGAVLEAALFQMNLAGRVVCCGAVSQYDTTDMSSPRGVPGLIVVKRLKLQGFIVMDFAEHDAQAVAELAAWAEAGDLVVVEDVISGLENAPAALIGLLAGENRGKRMIQVAEEE